MTEATPAGTVIRTAGSGRGAYRKTLVTIVTTSPPGRGGSHWYSLAAATRASRASRPAPCRRAAVASRGRAGHSGACLGLVRATGAQAQIDDKDLSPMVVDNVYEILSILTSVFNKPDQPHVRIT